VTCGRFVAQQVLEDLSLREKATSKASGRGAAVVVAAQVAAAGATPIPQTTVLAALRMLCQSIYAASAPPASGTTDWKKDPAALQAWLTGVLVETLVANGLVAPPPAAPASGFDRSQALAYMEQMAAWQPTFVSATLSFVASGYALQVGSPAGTPNEVAELASIAATLMQLKSSEPAA